MKTLYLLRHAKAEKKTPALDDFDRALTDKGIDAANKIREQLEKRNIQPDKIISSPAKRALQTAKIIFESNAEPKKIITHADMYSSSYANLIHIIKNTDENIQSLLLVGHNPSFNDLLHYVCQTTIYNIPKAGMVRIKLSEDRWSKITSRCGVCDLFINPKEI